MTRMYMQGVQGVPKISDYEFIHLHTLQRA